MFDTILDNIKTLLSIPYEDESKDNLILLLVEMEKEFARTYTNNPTLENDLLIMKMVVYKYNALGTEGLKSENYSGASYSYLDDYPINIQKDLNSNRKLKVL